MAERDLDWSGCFNARDLGGLATGDGRVTRRGALVRSDSMQRLDAEGWAAVEAHGVRTVIDLRNEAEVGEDAAARPASIETVRTPLDVSEDREFWDVWENGPRFATPLYYRPHLERFPERSAQVVAAIAGAAPGGVAFHCMGGRDRAGQVTVLLLALLGVAPEEIAADYGRSDARLAPLYASRGEEDPAPGIADFLRSEGTSAAEVIAATLAELDVEATLRAGGLGDDDLGALRERALDPA